MRDCCKAVGESEQHRFRREVNSGDFTQLVGLEVGTLLRRRCLKALMNTPSAVRTPSVSAVYPQAYILQQVLVFKDFRMWRVVSDHPGLSNLSRVNKQVRHVVASHTLHDTPLQISQITNTLPSLSTCIWSPAIIVLPLESISPGYKYSAARRPPTLAPSRRKNLAALN